MNGPRITNEDRGVTINKSLAWTMIAGLIGAGLWLGTELSGTKTALISLASEQSQRHAETIQYRRDAEQRFRALEMSRATDGSEIGALRRDLTEFRTDIRELKDLLRGLEGQLGRQR